MENCLNSRAIKIVFPLGLLALSFWPTGAGAAPAEYSLDDCFRAALKRSQTLANQVELINQAEEHVRQAQGSVMPAVSGQIGYTWQQPYNGTVVSTSTANSTYFWKVMADQPLFRGFREFAGISQTKSLVRSQAAAWDTAALQLYQDVAQAFYNLVTAERDLANLEMELALFTKRVKELNARLAIGRSRAAEVLTIQSSMATLRAQGDQAKSQIEVARDMMVFLTGLERGLILQDLEPMPQAGQALEQYVAHIEDRPDLRAQKEQVSAAEKGISVARGAHLPSVDLLGEYYFARSGIVSGINWDVQLALTVPIFAGGAIQSKVREAASQEKQAEVALSNLRLMAERDIRSIYSSLQGDQQQVDSLREATELSERNYDSQVKEYRLGLVTNLDVLQALTSFLESKRALDRLKFTAKFDKIRLEAWSGMRPGEILERARREQVGEAGAR